MLKPDTDPDPEKLENRIRIRIQAKKTDPDPKHWLGPNDSPTPWCINQFIEPRAVIYVTLHTLLSRQSIFLCISQSTTSTGTIIRGVEAALNGNLNQGREAGWYSVMALFQLSLAPHLKSLAPQLIFIRERMHSHNLFHVKSSRDTSEKLYGHFTRRKGAKRRGFEPCARPWP